MAAVTICSDFGAPKNKVWHCFHYFPIYFPWSDGTRSSFSECWALSQLFHSPLSLSSRSSLVLQRYIVQIYVFEGSSRSPLPLTELGKQYYPLRNYTAGIVKQTFLSLYRCTLYIKEGPVRQGLCYVQIFLCSPKNLNPIPS